MSAMVRDGTKALAVLFSYRAFSVLCEFDDLHALATFIHRCKHSALVVMRIKFELLQQKLPEKMMLTKKAVEETTKRSYIMVSKKLKISSISPNLSV